MLYNIAEDIRKDLFTSESDAVEEVTTLDFTLKTREKKTR